MQSAVIGAFLSAAFAAFLGRVVGPEALRFLPEMFSAVIALFVVFAGTRTKFEFVQAKYWLVLGALAVSILCGIILNAVEPGPLIGGMRTYLRALPIFFVPALLKFSDKQIAWQLRTIVLIALVQIPVAGYQRWLVIQRGAGEDRSGDSVIGTLNASGVLTVFLVGVATVIVALAIRKQISRWLAALLFLLVLIPTMINETKVTVFMLPAALLAVALIAMPSGRRLRTLLGLALVTVAFGAVFIPVYDEMQVGAEYKQEISLELLTNPSRNYMQQKNAGIGAKQYVGRLDAVNISNEYVSENPVRLVFGLGFGNVKISGMGEQFSGRYASLFEYVVISSYAILLLELGVLGSLLAVLLCVFVLKDSIVVARRDEGLVGALAAGWVGVCVVGFMSLFYIDTHNHESLTFAFWYFSGLIAARRATLAVAVRQRRVSPGTSAPVSRLPIRAS